MKHSKLLIGMALLASVSIAQAQTAGSIAGSSSQSGAAAGAIGIQINPTPTGTVGATGTSGGDAGGNTSLLSPVGIGVGGSSGSTSSSSNQNIVGSGNTYEAVDISKRVPGVWAAALTTSNGTCMGSFTSGVGVSGFGGSFGKTYTSDPCNVRFNHDRVVSYDKELAFEMMCSQKDVYEADARMAKAMNRKPRCVQPAEEEVKPVALQEEYVAPVDMNWFKQDPLTGAYSLIEAPSNDTAMIWGGDYAETQTNQ